MLRQDLVGQNYLVSHYTLIHPLSKVKPSLEDFVLADGWWHPLFKRADKPKKQQNKTPKKGFLDMPCSQTAQNNTTDVQLSAVCISVTVITPAISNKCQCFLTCLIPSVLRLFTCGPSSANYLFLS